MNVNTFFSKIIEYNRMWDCLLNLGNLIYHLKKITNGHIKND